MRYPGKHRNSPLSPRREQKWETQISSSYLSLERERYFYNSSTQKECPFISHEVSLCTRDSSECGWCSENAVNLTSPTVESEAREWHNWTFTFYLNWFFTVIWRMSYHKQKLNEQPKVRRMFYSSPTEKSWRPSLKWGWQRWRLGISHIKESLHIAWRTVLLLEDEWTGGNQSRPGISKATTSIQAWDLWSILPCWIDAHSGTFAQPCSLT